MAADETLAKAPSRAARTPISRRQIEVVIARSVATFGLAYTAFAVAPVIEQSRGMLPIWNVIIIASVFGGLVVSVVASLLNRGVRAANGYIAFSWWFAMLTWPLAIQDTSIVSQDPPWPWALLTVATAAAAVAWPVWAATAALVIMSVTFGIVRASPAGGSDRVDFAALNSIYAILLGGAALIIITLLRQAAASVDLAQSTAIDRYSNAVREHATEVERVQVDAIVHDSVLTTFLSAARADTPESRRLAGRMAENAMGYLRDAATAVPDAAGSTSLADVAEDIRAAAAGVPARFIVRRDLAPIGEMPSTSADALFSAAVQAMMNSAQHAGTSSTVRRWVSVRPGGSGGIEVEIGDTGRGFDPDEVRTARIGLRVSILERMANAGGRVEIDAAPGRGSVIRLSWPDRGALLDAARSSRPGATGAFEGRIR